MSDPSNFGPPVYMIPAGTWLTIDGRQWEVVDAFIAKYEEGDAVIYSVRGAFGHDVDRMSLLSTVSVPVPFADEPTVTIIEAVHKARSLYFTGVEAQPQPPPVRPATLAFLDTETTGLHPELHEVWEVGLIVREWRDEVVPQSGLHGSLSAEARPAGYEEMEYLWQLPVDLGAADPVGLAISGFHDRRWRRPLGLAADCRPTQAARSGSGWVTKRRKFAAEFAQLTRGAHLIGNVVDFDARRLDRLLRRFGALPEWHYHLIDVEALAVGYLRGLRHNPSYLARNIETVARPPWKSDVLMAVLGIEAPTDAERHTALGDARWAMRVYDYVMREDNGPPAGATA